MQESYEVAAQHTWTREELDIYEAQEFKIAVNQNVLETARMEGEKRKAVEIAKNLLASGLAIDLIVQATGLTSTEIQQLH